MSFNDAKNPKFSPEAMTEYEDLLTRYPNKMAPLLMVLHLAERQFSYLSIEVQEYVANLLELPPSHVQGVATFYTMYKRKQKGRRRIQYCATLTCAIMGAEKVYDHICKKLDLKNHGVEEDGLVSIEKVECLGACDLGPMMLVNDETHGNLTPEKFDALYEQWKKEDQNA
jgi:NADH-quinone oxidoreductase subunit E